MKSLLQSVRFAFQVLFALFALLFFPFASAHAQFAPASPLITARVDDAHFTVLKGNLHPLARPEFDRGESPADLRMDRMLLLLKRSPAQEAALQKFLARQLDPASADFHRWLSPQEFGSNFGPGNDDIEQVLSWLGQHGFQGTRVSSGRTVIEFSGTANQVSQAFHTAIHQYLIDGEMHWANAQDPSIPSALLPAVAGVVSLHNFPAHLPLRLSQASAAQATDSERPRPTPAFTFDSDGCLPMAGTCYGLGPGDLATIYNIAPAWDAGIDGAGQAIAIVAASNINMQDVRNFRALFGLPARDPVVILNGPDPGLVETEKMPLESEADVDLEWAGAVATNATLYLVVSKSTNSTFGMDLSAEYVVDHNLAPILSASYAGCEHDLGSGGNRFYNQLWQQAAAQGITVLVATGDNGAAGCEDFRHSPPAPASSGLQVNGRGSTPYNLAVGGTDFDDARNWAAYWNPENDPATQSSAKSYIPEMVWNDTCSNAVFGAGADPETSCNNPALAPLVGVTGGSGGSSTLYAKPSWQAAPGVPGDGMRDLPDVSLFAAGGAASASFYVLCEADINPDKSGAPCDLNPPYQHFSKAGGTSISVQVFAGIMALVNQSSNSRQGNVGPVLYALARQQTSPACDARSPAPACVFNDVGVGTNAVPCKRNSHDCKTNDPSHSYGVLAGFSAAPGYDLATGLGSVNAANLVNATGWAVNSSPDFTLSSPNAAVTVPGAAGSGSLTLLITALNGFSGTFNLGAGACSGLPAAATCNFTPDSVSLSAEKPTATATVTVTITATASATLVSTSRLPQPGIPNGLALSCLFGIGFSMFAVRQSRRRAFRAVALLLMVSLALLGCSGSLRDNPNAGKSNPVLTLSSGNLSHSLVFALTME